MLYPLQQAAPRANLIEANRMAFCKYMKMITLPKLRDSPARHEVRGQRPGGDRRAGAAPDRAHGRDRLARWAESCVAGGAKESPCLHRSLPPYGPIQEETAPRRCATAAARSPGADHRAQRRDQGLPGRPHGARPGLAGDRPRRVRLPRRPDRLRQVDPDQDADPRARRPPRARSRSPAATSAPCRRRRSRSCGATSAPSSRTSSCCPTAPSTTTSPTRCR